MKGIPIEKIEMMVDFNVNIQGDFEADFSEEKCNEKFAHVDGRLLAWRRSIDALQRSL